MAEVFSAENAAAGRAAKGVVRETDKAPVKEGIAAKTSERDAHAAFKIPVKAGLGTGGILKVLNERRALSAAALRIPASGR